MKLEEQTKLAFQKLTGRQEFSGLVNCVQIEKQPDWAQGCYGATKTALFFVDEHADLYVGQRTTKNVGALDSAGFILGPMKVSHNLANHYEMLYQGGKNE